MRPKPPPAVRVSGGRNTRFAASRAHKDDRLFTPNVPVTGRRSCQSDHRSGGSFSRSAVGRLGLSPVYSGRFSRGISSGSTSNLMERAWPGTRLMNPFSSSFKII